MRGAVVKVTSGSVQISGVALAEPASHVLTTSRPLGAGPLLEVETEAGDVIVGWIVGRDDTQNLALVKLIDGTLTGVEFGVSSDLDAGSDVLSISYPIVRPDGPIALETDITGLRTDLASGMRFFQLGVLPLPGTSGGPVFDRQGELVGINVEPSFMESLGLAVGEEGFALTAESVEVAIWQLTSGVMNLGPRPTPTAGPTRPPPVPVIFQGQATANGAPLPEGARLHARLVNPSLGDLWLSALVEADGAYRLQVATLNAGYRNSPIEFYVDGVRSGRTSAYVEPDPSLGRQTVINLDLSFP